MAQIKGVQVWPFPSQAHPRAGTRPPPLQPEQWSLWFMIAPRALASHLVGFTR